MTRQSTGRDVGYTLVEVLVVLLVVGILTGIAIPIFLAQRGRSHDSSTKVGVSSVGKEIATYYVDGAGPLTLDMSSTSGSLVITDGVWSATVNLTHGIAFPTTGGWAELDDPTGWCVSLTDPKGRIKNFTYSATNGLEAGTC